MSNSLFSVGITALNAAQAGMVVTQNNIANANTPGFHRQEVVQSTTLPQLTGSGYIGQGTSVDTIKRAYSEFLDNQVLQAQNTGSYLDTYYNQVRQISNMLADSQSGLTPAMQEFFNSLQALASDPSSMVGRQMVLSSGNTLADRFATLYARFKEMRDGVNTQLDSLVGEINSYAAQIAAINDQIVLAQNVAGVDNRQPNDMLDKRDQLIADLNQRIKVTTARQSDGSLNVFIGNGQPLVVGQTTFSLTTVQSPEDPDNLNVTYVSGSLNQSSLTGGNIGALLEFRSGILETAQNALGRMAVSLAQNFNDQHKLGMDRNGNYGGNFFSALSPYVKGHDDNTSGATLSASFDSTAVGQLSTSGYRVTYNSSGSTYTVTDLEANVSTTVAAAFISTGISGLTLTVSGTPADGDSFLVLPTRYAARDMGVAIGNVAEIAAGIPISTAAAQGNQSAATISAGSVNPPAPPDTYLLQPVTITFTSATAFNVSGTGTGNPTGVAYTSGGDITYNGWTVQISGTPAAGDVFTIQPNTGGVSDGRNALALTQLQTSYTMISNSSGDPTATFQGAYSQLVSQVGNKTREFEVRSQAQASLVAQTYQEQQALSGVNLDEEAANLLRYQQAYQAAGRAMQTAAKLFDTLLGILQ